MPLRPTPVVTFGMRAFDRLFGFLPSGNRLLSIRSGTESNRLADDDVDDLGACVESLAVSDRCELVALMYRIDSQRRRLALTGVSRPATHTQFDGPVCVDSSFMVFWRPVRLQEDDIQSAVYGLFVKLFLGCSVAFRFFFVLVPVSFARIDHACLGIDSAPRGTLAAFGRSDAGVVLVVALAAVAPEGRVRRVTLAESHFAGSKAALRVLVLSGVDVDAGAKWNRIVNGISAAS